MAVGTFDFYSECLKRAVTFQVILPNDAQDNMIGKNPFYKKQGPLKTLYLLNGYSGANADWIRNTQICDLALSYRLCVICPSGENSFYLDGPEAGRQYGTFVGQELVEYTRKTFPLSDKREDTYIGGLSMGGFGAIHTGLQFHDTFSKIIGLSSALIIHDVEKMEPGYQDEMANYEYYHMVFGDLKKVGKSRNNPEMLVKEILAEGGKMPEFFLAVGTEDFLYQENQIFKAFLEKNKVPFIYHEGPGAHDFIFWNQYLEPAIQWLLGAEQEE